MRGLYSSVAVGALGLAIGAIGPAQAANLVLNPGFSLTTSPCTSSTEFGTKFATQCVTDWSGAGYVFVFTTPTGPANAENAGSVGLEPATTFDNLTGGGGNFIAADPVFENPSQITQTITGLSVGGTYVLSFDYAGDEQTGFSGATTESWTATIGGSTFTTPTLSNVSQGFTGWQNYTSVAFTATATSELLTFLAGGGPSATQPPFDLLDNVQINQTTKVPEPMTLSLFGAGLAGIAGAAAFRRRKKVKMA